MIMREIDDGLGNSLITGGFELQTTCIPGSNPLDNKEANSCTPNPPNILGIMA